MQAEKPLILFVHGLWMHGVVFSAHRGRLRGMGRIVPGMEKPNDGMVTVAETRWPGARG